MTGPSIHHVEPVMGTTVSIDARDLTITESAARAAIDEAVTWLHHVDATFSTYRLDSEITRFGRGELAGTELSAEVRDVLHECIDLTRLTNGAFDAYAVPAPNGTTLDPSGYVKGWAIETAASLLATAGIENLCMNAGGDITTRGRPEPGRAWRAGIRHPEQSDRLARVIDLSDGHALATSATYERGAHIIDPATSQPTTELASATVIGHDLGRVDALATAVFVMGLDGIGWIESQPGFDAYVITHDGMTHWSTDFPASSR